MDKEIGNQVEIPDIYKVYFKSNLVKEDREKPLHMNAKTQFIKSIWNGKCIRIKSGAFNFIKQTTNIIVIIGRKVLVLDFSSLKINKETLELDSTREQVRLQTISPNSCTIFSASCGIFSKLGHMRGHKQVLRTTTELSGYLLSYQATVG